MKYSYTGLILNILSASCVSWLVVHYLFPLTILVSLSLVNKGKSLLITWKRSCGGGGGTVTVQNFSFIVIRLQNTYLHITHMK
jgi:predicted membrane-bound mannosyltransferase